MHVLIMIYENKLYCLYMHVYRKTMSVSLCLCLSLFLSISGFSKLQVCIFKSYAHVYQNLHFAWITFFVNYEFQNFQQLIFQIIL